MGKRKADLAAFSVNAPQAPPEPTVEAGKPERGLVTVTVEVTPAAKRQIKVMSAKQDKPLYKLHGEALNLLFKHYGEPEVG